MATRYFEETVTDATTREVRIQVIESVIEPGITKLQVGAAVFTDSDMAREYARAILRGADRLDAVGKGERP